MSALPVDVSGLSNDITAIAMGISHTCALTNIGAVKCWGNNSFGQLGTGNFAHSLTPVDVIGLNSNVSMISAGIFHTCAVMNTGAVKCWGYNSHGQLGDNSTNNSTTAINTIGLTGNVSSIETGDYHTCAKMTNGYIMCWGKNENGQLGNGNVSSSMTPVSVNGLGIDNNSLAAGSEHTCVISNFGTVKCWGYNNCGQLGNGTYAQSSSPIAVNGIDGGIVAITAGFYHTCALSVIGTVKCWGNNAAGQVGNARAKIVLIPVTVNNLNSQMRDVSAGYRHTCALTNGGAAKCWGAYGYGQLGDGTKSNYEIPVTVSGLSSGTVAIATGNEFACALTAGGGVKCWGAGNAGDLGNGSFVDSAIPVDVSGLNSGVIAIAVGERHACALSINGNVKCWGNNENGQLGNGSTINSMSTPQDVYGLNSDITAITAGLKHTCALTTTGAIKCWGHNYYGQLGDGSTTYSRVPVDVSGLNDIFNAIEAGDLHTCALTQQGAVKCWGDNQFGQLGNNSIAYSNIPINVNGLNGNVNSISAGNTHTCVIINGSVKCWGANDHGQLGNNNLVNSNTPVTVNGLESGATAISAGTNDVCAVVNANIMCWGDNEFRQLGDKTMSYNIPQDTLGFDAGAPIVSSTATHTPTPTQTPTATSIFANTPTPTSTSTATQTSTHTPTATATGAPTGAPTATPTQTPTATPTSSPPKIFVPIVIR